LLAVRLAVRSERDRAGNVTIAASGVLVRK
jgi:hypothetical protein